MLEKTKTIIHAILAFLLGILGFCLGRHITRSKTDDNKPNTERVESALSDAAGKLEQATGELRTSTDGASEITAGIRESEDQANAVGEHIDTASELIDAVIADAQSDADTSTRITELLDELKSRVDKPDEKLKN